MSCRLLIALFLTLPMAACGLWPSWHWERAGASSDDYKRDEIACKAQSYAGTDGMVTQASVRRMQGCLEARGWRKVPN